MDDFFGGVVIIVIIIFVWPVYNSFHSPTNGEHTGFVTAIENSGYIFHTTSAYFKTNTQSSQEDKYCVTDPVVIDELKQYQESNQNITIEYSNNFLMPFWQCKRTDQSIITGVK
jgi:hypothetical protein